MGWCSPPISWTNVFELNLSHTCIFGDHIRFHSLTDFSCGAPGCSKEPPPVFRPILQQQTSHRTGTRHVVSAVCTDIHGHVRYTCVLSLFMLFFGRGRLGTKLVVDMLWQMAKKYDFLFKLLLVGEDCVGKTSMLIRYAEDTFYRPFPTIGELSCSIHCANLSVVLVN